MRDWWPPWCSVPRSGLRIRSKKTLRGNRPLRESDEEGDVHTLITPCDVIPYLKMENTGVNNTPDSIMVGKPLNLRVVLRCVQTKQRLGWDTIKSIGMKESV